MSADDPQVFYMILVLPALFGLTLIGEGISQLVHSDNKGWFSMIFGIVFIGIVFFAYFYLSTYLVGRR